MELTFDDLHGGQHVGLGIVGVVVGLVAVELEGGFEGARLFLAVDLVDVEYLAAGHGEGDADALELIHQQGNVEVDDIESAEVAAIEAGG